MSAAWTALELSAIKNLKVEDEIGLLLSKAERLRRQEQEADIDALFDKELARLTNLPFAAFDILPRLLAAGYCDTALRMALAAYDKQASPALFRSYWAGLAVAVAVAVGSMGRSDEDAVVAGIPLGIALAAAHRHNEARPLLHDGLIVAYPRTQQLAAIKASLFDMSGRRGWRQTLANRAWAELAPVSKLWNAMFSEAGFYHVLSQIMESRYELERTWKSSGCQAEVKAKLDSLTRALKGLTNELGPEHVRVQCALREYGRAVASPQLKRHRQLRQALKSRGKELQGVVEESRRDQQALEALTRQLGQALAARQEQQVQDTIQQLFQLHMRRQGLKV
ncbi:hypothetical protein COHA_005270 [Chlorella ohadii]|uniref:Uncharacterized protein n=1 Tax=Chlorella ohadii TaxID=2649997 RepID=A0AAD5H6F4_9CHLO|nr:hypothetical protein COHA_005270 [Chlorella ohadii]